MGISSSYKLVNNSIVAFVAKYVRVYDQGGPPQFPPISGTASPNERLTTWISRPAEKIRREDLIIPAEADAATP
jgi:hypothetical protein